MSTKMPRLILMACVICPSLSWGLGLGEIHLHSALDEPLRADIDLVAATPNELDAVHASLAPVGEFTRYGIQFPPFLSTFRFRVVKASNGQPVLRVTSTDAIPEPFVTFLVEVDWARGHLMREYTVLLDPPVYAAGRSAEAPAPVAMPRSAPRHARPAPAPTESAAPVESPAAAPAAAASSAAPTAAPSSYRVVVGDTLSKIARSLGAQGQGPIDQTMLALFRENPDAFGGNVNVLHRGAILRVPGADKVAAVSEREAIASIDRQMSAWKSGGAAASGGHLRLVAPGASGGTGGAGGATGGGSGNAQVATLSTKVKDLETQLAAERRLLDLRNQQLAELQAKLGAPAAPAAAPAASAASAASAVATPAPLPAVSKPVVTALHAKPAAAPASRSWLDWITSNWWLPGGIVAVLLAALGFAAFKRRQDQQIDDFASMGGADVATDVKEHTPRILGSRKPAADESFVVEESGEHKAPEFTTLGDTAEVPSPDDTMSSESAVNLDQGDPLAEADFHMAYGLYDQAADLVRIALEREPERRDLRLKLLEIYFVWGNKDLFLQTAKTLYATRDRAPAGEWDKIVIMGKQICPEDPLFAHAEGGGRGAGALVDLNLEGGENHVDVDLFGEPAGERSPQDLAAVKGEDTAATGESPRLPGDTGLDFVLDAPERGAEDSPTREMPPRDEPTVESELLPHTESPTMESPAPAIGGVHDLLATKLPATNPEHTAEVSIDDLGLDLDMLDETGAPAASGSHLEETDHPSDAPTMVAGLDAHSRKLMADAESRARDRDLTELERELEASFISEMDTSHEGIQTAVIAPDAAPTVQMPREVDPGATSRFKATDITEAHEAVRVDPDSTSRLRSVNVTSGDSIDLDLDRLAGALGGGDTVDQPRAAEDLFSSEVFEASQRSRRVDLDVGESLKAGDGSATKTLAQPSTEILPVNGAADASAEFEPVTMSEVGTKLDLARAYMDMGDPEGARSILDEVVHEGSASQKQEAQRLLQSLPG